MGNEWEMPKHEAASKEHLDKVKSYFEENKDEIHAFASKYEFQIDKFTRQSTTWDLRAKHPKGGWFTIFIGLSDKENVLISGVWSIDVYETFSMYWKNKNFINHYIAEVNLTEWLEKAFLEILSWNVDELDVVKHEGYYKNSWEKYKTKEDWEKRFQHWPQNYPKGHEPWASDGKDKK